MITQVADDTTLFLKDSNQIPNALKAVSLFLDASGLHLHLKKYEILTIHDNIQNLIYNIPVKKEITYLGILQKISGTGKIIILKLLYKKIKKKH